METRRGGYGNRIRVALGAAIVPVALATPALDGGAALEGQVMPSERATVSQTVDGTVITLDYARPRARGRPTLFGGVVDHDRAWTPGANDATVLDVSRDVRIDGMEVPAGRWSVWMIVRDQGPWEMILDPRDDLWHTVHPGPTPEQIRWPVEPVAAEHAEALIWSFPDVRRSGTTLTMTWGTTRVALEVEVEPTYRYTMEPAEAAPFLGEWDMERVSGRNAGELREVMIIHDDDGSLRLRSRSDDGSLHWVLQPRAEGIFQLAWTREGELWAGSDTHVEMLRDDAGAWTAFEIRGGNDRVLWSGRR